MGYPVRKVDPQISEMAGEFLTVGKLFKLGLQASVTMGNAKKVDILAYNPMTDKNFNIQVKTCRKKNCFPMKRENITASHIYVFVFLNEMMEDENFYILMGSVILKDINKFFGASYQGKVSPIPGINYGPLKEYEDKWEIFME